SWRWLVVLVETTDRKRKIRRISPEKPKRHITSDIEKGDSRVVQGAVNRQELRAEINYAEHVEVKLDNRSFLLRKVCSDLAENHEASMLGQLQDDCDLGFY